MKEWEEQLKAAMDEQRAKQARVPHIRQDAWQAVEERRVLLAREIESKDELHRGIINEFLGNIQARHMLEVAKRVFFLEEGEIKPRFESIQLREETGVQKVLYGNGVSVGELSYHEKARFDFADYFLSGLELSCFKSRTLQSFRESISIIFVGFLGKRTVSEQLAQGQDPVKYSYSKFGVTHAQMQSDIHYIDFVSLARIAVTGEFKREPHQGLLEMRNISESELYLCLQSLSFQQQAQSIVQADILQLARSGIFAEKG